VKTFNFQKAYWITSELPTRSRPDLSPSQLKLSLSSLRATPPQSNTL